MASKAVYARLETELYNRVKAHGEATGRSISSTVEYLVQRGITKPSSEDLIRNLEKEVAQLKEKVQALEKAHAELQGSNEALKAQLETCRAKESIALSAQAHAALLQRDAEAQKTQIEKLRNYLLTPIATCKKCQTQLRLFDVGQRKCQYCGTWGIDWLPSYAPPPTTWEAVRDVAAVVGAATIVVALLNALSGRQDRSGSIS